MIDDLEDTGVAYLHLQTALKRAEKELTSVLADKDSQMDLFTKSAIRRVVLDLRTVLE